MNRKTFIQRCGMACLSITGMSTLVSSCASTQSLSLNITNNKDLIVPLSLFVNTNKIDLKEYKKYIVVSNERLNYPIVVYRHSATEYTALLLRCSHQYNELTANGDLLICPAHGSEFNNKGEVVQGPAEDKLRSFPVTVESQKLLIHLA